MSFAVARTAFAASARASLRTARVSRAGARRLNSTHAAPAKKSDTPWIVGSAIVFGPALLYLLSPSARKNTKHAHNDAHDFPGHHAKAAEEAHEPVIQKDDEGTEADVSQSLTRAEQDDVPKAEPEASKADAEKAEAESAETPATSKSTATDPEPHTEEPSPDAETQAARAGDKTTSFEGEKEPVDQGTAREAAKDQVTPKEADSKDPVSTA